MTDFKVHNVNFFNVDPKPISCIAHDNNRLVAVSRSDSTIEIWDCSLNAYRLGVIAKEKGRTVEALVFVGSRLFSTGLNADITEYDVENLRVKRTLLTSFGPCWCMAANKENSTIAVGTEDGYICLYNITEEKVEFDRSFDKQEGRVLCLNWHESSKKLVTGSIGAIKVWNVAAGRCEQRMTLAKDAFTKDTAVWCVVIASDMTVISGDSRGMVSFWNGHMGTLISGTKSHRADILCLYLNEAEDTVYASGIDPVIIQFEKVHEGVSVKRQSVSSVQARVSHQNNNSEYSWVKAFARRAHTHDVKAITEFRGLLVSGGLDSNLAFSRYPNIRIFKAPPLPSVDSIGIAPERRLILLRFDSRLEIWKLGDSKKNTGDEGEFLDLSENALKLVDLRSKNDDFICAAAISKDGRWIAYSTSTSLRVFKLNFGDSNTVVLKRITRLPSSVKPSSNLAFCSAVLLSITSSNTVEVMGLSDDCVVQAGTLTARSELKDKDHQSKKIVPGLRTLVTGGNLCAASCRSGNIYVWNVSNFELVLKLPRYRYPATGLAFNRSNTRLAVTYADRKLIEYDLQTKDYSVWSKWMAENPNEFPSDWTNRTEPIRHVTYDGDDVIIMHDEAAICRIQLQPKPMGKKKRMSTDGSTDTPQVEITVSHHYKPHLIYFGLLRMTTEGASEAVAVQFDSRRLMQQLPPALKIKKFGT